MPILLRGARQLLTPYRVIPNGALLIDNGIIVEVGAASRIERLRTARKAQTIDADGRVILPAFVDPLANLLSGSDLGKWSAQRMHHEARRRLDAFIRNGTITIGAAPGATDQATRDKALRVLNRLDEDPVRIVTSPAEGGAAILTPARDYASAAPYPRLPPSTGGLVLATAYDAAACPIASMPFVLSLAITQMRMAPADAIAAATIHAARALGVDARTGSLEAGKDADLLILDAPDFQRIAWLALAAPIALVLRKGRPLYQKEAVRC
jgi:imidazolonepropionase-like amidohydrolase